MKKIFTKISLLFIGLMLCAGNAWAETQTIDGITYDLITEGGNYAKVTGVTADGVNAGRFVVMSIPNYGDIYGSRIVIPATVEYDSKTYTINAVQATLTNSTLAALASPNYYSPYIIRLESTDIIPTFTGSDFTEVNLEVHYSKKEAYETNLAGISYYDDISTFGEPDPGDAPLASGTCGTDLNWGIYNYHNRYYRLEISGSGTTMADYNGSDNKAPWIDNATMAELNESYLSAINKIELPEGLTHIGNYAFKGIANPYEINFPESLSSIGEHAFDGCDKLGKTISYMDFGEVSMLIEGFMQGFELPASLTTIGAYAFNDVSDLTIVRFLGYNLNSLGTNAFPSDFTLEVLIDEGHVSEAAVMMSKLSAYSSKHLIMNRQIKQNGNYNTLCLPFTVTNPNMIIGGSTSYDIQMFAFSGSSIVEEGGDKYLNLDLTPATTIEAGEPFFFQYVGESPSEDDATFLSFTDVNIEPSTTTQNLTRGIATLHGTLSETNISGQNYLFLAANNNLKWYAGEKTIPAFRAYFEVAGGASLAPKARIVAHENTTTGVEDVAAEVKAVKFVENGQILIKRGEAVYNLQGQVVK